MNNKLDNQYYTGAQVGKISLLPCIIAFSINMLYLNKFTDNIIIKSSAIFFSIWAIIYYSNGKLFSIKSLFINYPKSLLLLLLIVSIGLIRSSNPQITLLSSVNTIISLILFSTLTTVASERYLTTYSPKKAYNLFYYIIILPTSIYCIINLLLWAASINVSDSDSTNIGQSMLLAKIGLNVTRVKFPLASGINSFSTVVGAVLTLAIPFFIYTKGRAIIGLVSIASMVIVILLTDSRSALFYPFFIFILFHFSYKKKAFKKSLNLLPYVPIIGPFILIITLQYIASSDAMSYFMRSDTDLENGNSRVIIWSAAVLEFLQVKVIHLIGYGDYGHVASGASSQWSALFELWGNSDTMHPHNSTLAILFDYGYIGLATYLICLKNVVSVFKKPLRYPSLTSILTLSFILYLTLIGLSESFFGFYYLNSLQLLFAVVIITLSIDRISQHHDRLNQIYPIPYSASGGTSFERSSIHAGLVQFRSGEEKQELSAANS